MKVAKVIGNIWATRKEEKLAGLKLLLVQPLVIMPLVDSNSGT